VCQNLLSGAKPPGPIHNPHRALHAELQPTDRVRRTASGESLPPPQKKKKIGTRDRPRSLPRRNRPGGRKVYRRPPFVNSIADVVVVCRDDGAGGSVMLLPMIRRGVACERATGKVVALPPAGHHRTSGYPGLLPDGNPRHSGPVFFFLFLFWEHRAREMEMMGGRRTTRKSEK